MTINWFPGHMHKARKEISEIMPQISCVIEILDARIPYSSENPMIAELREQADKVTPTLKLLNKSDLADEEKTRQWIEYFESQNQVKALPVNMNQPEAIRKVLNTIKAMFPNAIQEDKQITCLVAGIPNVGKSTIINTLTGRAIAKTGNEPAITKGQQKIHLKGQHEGITLIDTPGMLWPKIENQNSGYRLAATSAIKNTAVDYDDIAFYAVEYLAEYYPQRLQSLYTLSEIDAEPLQNMEAIGRVRKCLAKGGSIDLDRVSRIILNDLRDGTLGRLTLETPEMIIKELESVEIERKLKAEKKAQRLSKKKKRKFS
jgi:ribosome biogenesis GTPase A